MEKNIKPDTNQRLSATPIETVEGLLTAQSRPKTSPQSPQESTTSSRTQQFNQAIDQRH